MNQFEQQLKSAFPFVSAEAIEVLLSISTLVQLKENEIWVSAGSRTTKAALIVDGLMRNFIVNPNGEETTVVFAASMQVIAPHACLFLNKPATETTQAVQPSLLLVADYFEIKKRAIQHQSLSEFYFHLMEKILLAAIERIEDFTHRSPQERYRHLVATHGFLIEQAPLKYVASYLGITPVSLSRIRKRVHTASKEFKN